MLMPFIIPILWAIVMGIVLYPAYRSLKDIIRSDTLSALLMAVAVFMILIVPFSIVSVMVFQQLVEATQGLIAFFQNNGYREIVEKVKAFPFVEEYMDRLQPIFEFLQREEFKRLMSESLNRILKFFGDKLGQIAFVAGKNVFYVFVFLLTFFFILRDGRNTLRRFERLIPMDQEDLESILGTIYRTILAVVYGSLGTAFIQALLGFVAYSIVGIEYALLWSVLTFFAAFIPPFGASAVWFPLSVFSFFNLGLWQGIFLGAWGLFLISTMDNFVRPLIIKKGIRIPYGILFFATGGGFLKFGFVGLFLGPIMFTTLFTLFNIYEKRVLNQNT